jgi:radical SAM protein with 4Fe4S-binding SPASM domain
MRENPFHIVYAKMNAGDSKYKHAHLPDFPRLIDVELTNTCNFRCLMCHTGTFTVKRPKGMMSEDVFARILDEAAAHGTALRFSRWGEPLLHPKAVDFIRACRQKGVLTHINTNGSKLTDAMIEELCAIPLDSLKFSFQGVDEKSFREMRNIDFFAGLIEVIRRTAAIRGDRERPFLHVSTSTTYETPEQIAAFRQQIAPMVDMLTIGRTVFDRLDLDSVRLRPEERKELERLIELQSVNKAHFECPEVYDKMAVDWDGKVTACCQDHDRFMTLGDVAEQSLAEIWKCEKMEYYRSMLADMRHDELPLCATCWAYTERVKTPNS